MDNKDCIFCRIAEGLSPAQIEFKDDEVVAFWDIEPNAPTHILIIGKKHIPSLQQATDSDKELLGRLLLTANEIARRKNLEQRGYRVVINTGSDAHQVVDHLHVHLLAGGDLGPMTNAERNPVSQYS